MMREFTGAEQAALDAGTLPCGHRNYFTGPSVGECTNLECADCGSQFNVMRLHTRVIGVNVLREAPGYTVVPLPVLKAPSLFQRFVDWLRADTL